MIKLAFITAYYKADTDKGIAISISEGLGNLAGVVDLITDTWNDQYEAAIADSTTADLIQALFQELDTLAQSPRHVGLRESLLALGNIQLLIKAGALAQDEFNGIAMIYEHIT